MKRGNGSMSKKITIETESSSKGTGLILFDCPATLMSDKDLNSWAIEHAKQYDDGLLKGLLVVASLTMPFYTLWEGDVYI